MPIVCFNRPNRTKIRHFSEADVARVFCTAVDHGANAAEIIKRIELKCDRDVCQTEKIRELVDSIAGAALFIALAVSAARAVLLVARASLLLFRRIPVIRRYIQRASTQAERMDEALVEVNKIIEKARQISETIGTP